MEVFLSIPIGEYPWPKWLRTRRSFREDSNRYRNAREATIIGIPGDWCRGVIDTVNATTDADYMQANSLGILG
jgi:hypothetical protein